MGQLYSMTGYASEQGMFRESELNCEIRSLNSRYLELSVKLPKQLSDMESQIKELLRKKISRGKIQYSLNFSSITGELQNLRVDSQTVKIYHNLLKQIKNAAQIQEPISLEHLLFFKDVISYEETKEIDKDFMHFVFQLTEATVAKLNEMRALEGTNIFNDIQHRLKVIEDHTHKIRELGQQNSKVEFEKLYKRLLSLVKEEEIDRSRLEQELAIISDRVDITEETVRMDSHLKLFDENVNSGSPIGKNLNFLLQEMHREANTMSNKTTMVEISHRVVTIKEEIEKLREQIQNIE